MSEDGWFTVLCYAVFFILLLFSRGGREAKVLAQFIWSVIAIIAFAVFAVIAVFKGKWILIAQGFGVLAIFLTMTGFIPGLIIQYWGFWRKETPPSSTPLSNTPINVDFISQGGLVKHPPKPDAYVREKQLVCPKCGHQLRRRSGKYGPFMGCAGYPSCKYTQSIQ
jgi:hypothetical protein